MADPLFINPADVIGRPATGSEKKEPSSVLGKDDFFKILITQLSNQDPLQPMEDREFIAQMAQFTSLEQLGNMANELKLLRQSLGASSSLIGKVVSWMGKDENGNLQKKSGIVDSIIIRDGSQYASVKGEEILLESISKIENPEEIPEEQPDEIPGEDPQESE